MADDLCMACGASMPADYKFCENCGHERGAPLTATAPPVIPTRYLTSVDPTPTCPACGADEASDGFCDSCGQRRPSGKNHTELDLGAVAGVTDIGHRHHVNEDAIAIGVASAAGGAVVGIVCDGVSSSSRADTASHAAVAAAITAMLDALGDGDDPETAMEAGARSAQAAAALVGGSMPGPNPPSCTFVSAIVTADALTVGWVGDSRAYWLPDGDDEPLQLTVDDSLATTLAAAGVTVHAIAENPHAGALMRWMGSDATDTEPHIKVLTPTGPGRVLVCSDGLFRYRPVVTDLAASVPKGPSLATAQSLVQLALDEGGQDNVSVILIPYPLELVKELGHG
jgi:serine/threonine protein phosphatase PrpC